MFNAITLYRVSRWLYLKRVPFFPKIIQGVIFVLYNCHLSYLSEIGKGTFLLHKGMATLILEGVKIGFNTRIGMNVMIVGKGPYKHVPEIGNNVWIGPGSIITGPVKVLDNMIIAPNSLVNKSVPEGAIVGGSPAKIIGWKKDLDYDILNNESWKDGFMDFLC